MGEDIEKKIRKNWGSDEAFYQAQEEFLNFHMKEGASIEYIEGLNMPVRAIYRFQPLLAWRENEALFDRMREEFKKDEDI